MKIKFFFLATLAAFVTMMSTSCSDSKDSETPVPPSEKPEPPQDPDKDTSGPYKIGDFYKEGNVIGVVFYAMNNGTHGKIVSLDEGSQLRWSASPSVTGATSAYDGMDNTTKIKSIPGWESQFPVFEWCETHNKNGVEGWYVPSVTELQLLYDGFDDSMKVHLDPDEGRNNFNRTLVKHNGTPISEVDYCSSSECSNIAASRVNFKEKSTFCGIKAEPAKVRAIRSF